MKTPVELTLIELSPGGIDLEMFLEIDGALSKTNTSSSLLAFPPNLITLYFELLLSVRQNSLGATSHACFRRRILTSQSDKMHNSLAEKQQLEV